MGLELKKVKYTSRNGYALEWQEPYSIRFNAHEILLLSTLLHNLNLTDKELEESFDWEEREVIYRYQQKAWEKVQTAMGKITEQNVSMQQLARKFKDSLAWALDIIKGDWSGFLKNGLQWSELDQQKIKANKAFKQGLKTIYYQQADFQRLLDQYGAPTQAILEQVEARVGILQKPDAS